MEGWVVNEGWSCLRNQGRMKLGTGWQDKFGKIGSRSSSLPLPTSAQLRTKLEDQVPLGWGSTSDGEAHFQKQNTLLTSWTPQQHLLPWQPNISPAPKSPRVRDPKALPAAEQVCSRLSPWDRAAFGIHLHWHSKGKSSRSWGRSIKIGSRCKTWIFQEVSSIFTLSRESRSEVDGWSGVGIRNWQISTLGQDEELSDCIFFWPGIT